MSSAYRLPHGRGSVRVRHLAVLLLLTAPLSHAEDSQDALRDMIVAQERAELDSLKTGDMTAFANFLADDAVLVDARGSAGKAEVVEHTSHLRLHEYTISDVHFVPISADSGLIVYNLVESGNSHGKEFTAKVHVSALWAKRRGKWVCVFGQESEAR
jgi:ketosteroid isomerase-like protein